MKKALWALFLLGVFGMQAWAQTEASMCVTITNTDDSGSHWDSTDYFIPVGQQISKTYFQFDQPTTDGIRVDCYRVNLNGTTGTRIWTVNETFCGCGSSNTKIAHPIAGGQTIRFRVYRTWCPGHDMSSGSSVVRFYTSATAASCPDLCQGS